MKKSFSRFFFAFTFTFTLIGLANCVRKKPDSNLREIVGAEAEELVSLEIDAEAYTKLFKADPLAERRLGWELFRAALSPATVWDDETADNKNTEYLPRLLAWFTVPEIAEIIGQWAKKKGFTKSEDLQIPSDQELDGWFGATNVGAAIKGEKTNHEFDAIQNRLQERRYAYLKDSTAITGDRVSESSQERIRGRLVPGRETVLYSPSTARVLAKSYLDLLKNCGKTALRGPSSKRSQSSQSFLGNQNCLTEELPQGAAQARVFWAGVDEGSTFPTFPTADLNWEKLSGTKSWTVLRSLLTLNSEHLKKMFTVAFGNETASSQKLGLVAFHLGVKANREHFWSTYWWTPNPNEAPFGSDRNLGAKKLKEASNSTLPFLNHFNMCTVSRFEPVSHSQFVNVDEKSSWCSNPYIESAPKAQFTNCIGCHQHAGSSVDQAQVFSGNGGLEETFPVWGNTKRVDAHPGDFLWGVVNYRTALMESLQRAGVAFEP